MERRPDAVDGRRRPKPVRMVGSLALALSLTGCAHAQVAMAVVDLTVDVARLASDTASRRGRRSDELGWTRRPSPSLDLCAQGNPVGCRELGLRYRRLGAEDQAAQRLGQACDLGDQIACDAVDDPTLGADDSGAVRNPGDHPCDAAQGCGSTPCVDGRCAEGSGAP